MYKCLFIENFARHCRFVNALIDIVINIQKYKSCETKGLVGMYELPYIIRPDRQIYINSSIVFILLIFISSYYLIYEYSRLLVWLSFILLILLITFNTIYATEREIQLFEDKMVYKKLFSKNEMAYSDMSEIEIIHISRGIRGIKQAISLSGVDGRNILMNPNRLRNADVSIILDVLKIKAPQIKVNEYEEMVLGRYENI